MRALGKLGKGIGPDGASHPGTAVLIAAVLVALGALLGLVLAPTGPPGPIRAGQAPEFVEVETEAFHDERLVELSVELDPGHRIFAPASGVITALACEAGTTIKSGTSPLSLNGTPLVALATAVPLWRDLEAGTSGSDVRALQKELNRLELDVDETGRHDAATQRAVAELARRVGARSDDGVLSLTSVVWLPDRSSAIASCDADLGASVMRGAAVATLAAEIESISIAGQPPNLLPGARRLVVDEVEVAVDMAGRVAEPSGIRALAETDTFSSGQLADENPVQGRYLLADPLPVSRVPPGAIVVESPDRACVIADDGTAHVVRVVASIVGRSLIEWVELGVARAADPPHRVQINPREAQRCA